MPPRFAMIRIATGGLGEHDQQTHYGIVAGLGVSACLNAAAAGLVETDHGRIPRIQILTTGGILNYRDVPRLPVIDTSAFKKAPKEKRGGQGDLGL